MKKFIALLFLAVPLLALAQTSTLPINKATGKVSFSGSGQVAGTSKDELYNRAREWFAFHYRAVDAVMETDSKAAGKLVGKAYRDVQREVSTASGTKKINSQLWYTFTIQVKDGSYQYQFKDFHYIDSPDQTPVPLEKAAPRLSAATKSGIVAAINETARALKTAISTKAAEKDWEG